MEVRLLTEMEIPAASYLAVNTFDYCLRKTIYQQELVDGFLQYASVENLMQMVRGERLKLWGVWQDGQLCAMSGMQSEGHITMLYVHPYFQRRGFGKRLLLEMRKYASEVNNLTKVTVSAMPAWTCSYFERCGFGHLSFPAYGNMPFVPLVARSIKPLKYRVKPINEKVLVSIVAGFLGIIVFLGAGFMTYYMLTH